MSRKEKRRGGGEERRGKKIKARGWESKNGR